MTKIGIPDLLKALRSVAAPDGRADIVEEGFIAADALRLEDGHATFVLTVPGALSAQDSQALMERAKKTLESVPGIESVRGVTTTCAPPPAESARSGGSDGQARPVAKHLIAVASGKGGVGKSTVAVNLALALAARGLRVGILDADIYGPSLPRLLGLRDFRPARTEGEIDPAHAFGLSVMSIGFMLPADGPVVWRGPMVQSAILQMLRETRWGYPDILVIDMPPGTGDAQIALAQRAGLSGAVVVSTPQDVALADARKGLETFRKLDVPIIGLVENMSVFVCPCCGTPTPVFGQGGARREAATLGVPFLGTLPILPELCAASDAGTPLVASQPDSPAARPFHAMAEQVQSFCSRAMKNPSIPP
jgi:ATP-binding protein involved in chromosome partitioning